MARAAVISLLLDHPAVTPPLVPAYNSTVPVAVQNESWTCSVYAGDWSLRSLGIPSDDETLEREMLAADVVSPQLGLLDARGYGLAAVLRAHGAPAEVNERVTWAWLIETAGLGPIALGGRNWNHWVGVRRLAAAELSLANSAPGHMGVQQHLDRFAFDRLGPWSAVRVPAAVPPWLYWSADEIAAASGCPASAVRATWPLIHAELKARGIADRDTCAAAVGTVAVETASTFAPVREAFWLSEQWRRENLRYYPFYGRGIIQLTWDYNYRTYGQLLGIDLLADPDRALEPSISAAVMAEYFQVRGVATAARAHDWTEVRRRVQGGEDGLDRLVSIVTTLGVA